MSHNLIGTLCCFPWVVHMWLCREKHSFCDYCSLRHSRLWNNFLRDDCCTYTAGKKLNGAHNFEQGFQRPKSHPEGNHQWFSSRSGEGSVSVKTDVCFRPLTKTEAEWMWEGKCISDARMAYLCKDSCKLYFHEQLEVKEQFTFQEFSVFFTYYFWRGTERKVTLLLLIAQIQYLGLKVTWCDKSLFLLKIKGCNCNLSCDTSTYWGCWMSCFIKLELLWNWELLDQCAKARASSSHPITYRRFITSQRASQ